MTNPTFAPSTYQQAVFDAIANGQGDIMINAVAGSGKTTTLKQAARLLPADVTAVFCAFNKHIADELKLALKGTPVAASTIHSIGLGCLYPAMGRPQIEGTKYNKIVRGMVDAKVDELMHNGVDVNRNEANGALLKLVNMARLTLTDPKDPRALDGMAARFGITAEGWIFDMVERAIAEGTKLAERAKVIDFADMLYLPFVWGLKPAPVQWVFVDECQDLNAAQLDLVLKLRAPGGRMVFVGDPKQSIYGFAGADPQSFWNIKTRTQATELPLSICYRCPAGHLDLARALVPHIEARPEAPAGVVEYMPEDRLGAIARSGDLVLCRLTAPLISWCIKLIAQRVNARVKGRDLGKDLSGMVDAVAKLKGFDFDNFLTHLETYRGNQVKNILAKNPDAEAEVDSVNDRVEAIGVCYQSFMAPSVAALKAEIEGLFTDGESAVTFATVHRAKGLENERVILLQPEKMPLIRKGQKAWEIEQEYNLLYVALTRAKAELVIMGQLTIAPAPAGVPLAEQGVEAVTLNALHRSIATVAAEIDQEAVAAEALEAAAAKGAYEAAEAEVADLYDLHSVTIVNDEPLTPQAVANEAGKILFGAVAIAAEIAAADRANDEINMIVDAMPQHDQEAWARGQATMPIEALDLTGVGRCNDCTACRSGAWWNCTNAEAGPAPAHYAGIYEAPEGRPEGPRTAPDEPEGLAAGDMPLDLYMTLYGAELAADHLEQEESTMPEPDLNECPEVLGVQEVAERLGRPERTIQLWVKAGRFPGARQISGVWVIPRSALAGFAPPQRGNPNIAAARAARAVQ